MTRLTLRRPDDWHLHLRDGDVMAGVLPESRHMARALIMPNLVPPVVTVADACAYRDRILAALPRGQSFTPMMSLYLTEGTDPEDVATGAADGSIIAVKLYPAGATTNSDSGVRAIDAVMPILERMAEIDLPLCVHGEVTDPDIDIFDREAVFIDRVLDPLRHRVPGLRVVMEHVTTAEGIDYVQSVDEGLAATLTVHHLIIDRNALFRGGIRPHYFCLPVAKRARHRDALLAAATSGDTRVFLGTDSAPHTIETKEDACGCAGIFTAPNAMACLAQVFENANSLDNLEGFVSVHGAGFYRLPLNDSELVLERSDTPFQQPQTVETGAGPVRVFDPEIPIHWRVVGK